MIDYVLLKIASRCNFDCTYCYWFRDPSVRHLPPLMSPNVISAFISALERHIIKNELKEFVCSFHGGEPLLFGHKNLRDFIERLELISMKTNCHIRYALTTNGALIDTKWIKLITDYSISIAISIDGPPEVHDKRRKTIRGLSTWESTVSGYLELCRANIKPSILAVCDPTSDPKNILDHFTEDLGVVFCDFLMPDADHSRPTESIAQFYIQLFDHWYDNYMDKGIEVRILNDFLRGIMGLQTKTDSIGFAPIKTVCLNTSGRLEPHDVLRISGEERVATNCSILTNEISDIELDPLWLSVKEASTLLSKKCQCCRFRNTCGGGHIAQRWSDELHYNNPSVYCYDFIKIFEHIASKISFDIESNMVSKKLDCSTIEDYLIKGNPSGIFL